MSLFDPELPESEDYRIEVAEDARRIRLVPKRQGSYGVALADNNADGVERLTETMRQLQGIRDKERQGKRARNERKDERTEGV